MQVAITSRHGTLSPSAHEHIARKAEKLLTFALGRGLDYNDGPAVREIAAEAARGDYRFSSLILGVVRSVPFQMKIKASQ